MKAGILFSGQGAQYSGMGADFYQNSQAFRQRFDVLSTYLEKDLVEICQNQHDQLTKTINVQPAIAAFGLSIFDQLRFDLPQLEIVGMLGLSLGEYTALMAAKALSPKEGIKLLAARAAYMQADADRIPGAMAAVLRANQQIVENICQAASTENEFVGIANYNTDQQLVIGGHFQAVKRAVAMLKAAGIRRVIFLKVNGAFHTPLFAATSLKLKKALANVKPHPWQIPVISNTISQPFSPQELQKILARQVVEPTHFAACLKYLKKNLQPDILIEVGPGKTLSRFAQQLEPDLPTLAIGKWEDYQTFLTKIK
jgi:[acyl-carrier-protein] S-malonyltransferase